MIERREGERESYELERVREKRMNGKKKEDDEGEMKTCWRR